MTFWDFFWLMISFVLYVSYLVVLFLIVKDIFADSTRTGWSKAIWVLVLLFLPVIGRAGVSDSPRAVHVPAAGGPERCGQGRFRRLRPPNGRDQPRGTNRPGQDPDGRRRTDGPRNSPRSSNVCFASNLQTPARPRMIHPREMMRGRSRR